MTNFLPSEMNNILPSTTQPSTKLQVRSRRSYVCVKQYAQTYMQTHTPTWSTHTDNPWPAKWFNMLQRQVCTDKVTNGLFNRNNATKWGQVGRDAYSVCQFVYSRFSSTQLRQSRKMDIINLSESLNWTSRPKRRSFSTESILALIYVLL